MPLFKCSGGSGTETTIKKIKTTSLNVVFNSSKTNTYTVNEFKKIYGIVSLEMNATATDRPDLAAIKSITFNDNVITANGYAISSWSGNINFTITIIGI